MPGGENDEIFLSLVGEDLDPPLVSARCVAFVAVGDMGTQGVYLVRDGEIEVVADTHTLVPGGAATERFAEFEEAFALDGCDVAFDGTGTADTLGIYLKRAGLPLAVIADTHTSTPTGNFVDFEDPWLEAGVVVFRAATTGDCGVGAIYLNDADELIATVDPCGGTPVPSGQPGETFVDLESRPILRHGVLTFAGVGDLGTRGVYAQTAGEILVVADTNTPIPEDPGAVFSGFLPIAPTSNGETVFLGAGPETIPPFTHVGLYRAGHQGLQTVIDLLSPPPLPGWVPGDSPSFADEDFPGFWFDGDVTLGAVGAMSPESIFLIEDADISAVIAAGDDLGGQPVAGLSRFAHQRGDRLVFVASRATGASVYLANRVLFADGFESGNTDGWSSAVP